MIISTKLRNVLCIKLFAASLLCSASLQAAEPMSDEALSSTTARGYEVNPNDATEALNFSFSGLGVNKDINGSGNLKMQRAALTPSNSNVIISDYAQSNLNAMMNINSANSIIQVLMNLNINVNSEVGSVVQGNTAAQP